jgi:hypothetical protein
MTQPASRNERPKSGRPETRDAGRTYRGPMRVERLGLSLWGTSAVERGSFDEGRAVPESDTAHAARPRRGARVAPQRCPILRGGWGSVGAAPGSGKSGRRVKGIQSL